MAITVHSAGQQTTANDSSASNNQNVTLAAGSNRRLFVCVQVEHAGGDESEGISAITYGGNALTQVTDGADPALIDLSVAHIEWFQLLEADMPANGSQALNVTLTVSRQCTVGWIILEGCDQSANVEYTNFEGSATTGTSLTISGGFDVSDEDRMILLGCYTNTTGGHSATIGGVTATEHYEAENNQGGAFMSMQTRILTTQTGTIAAVFSHTSTNRRCAAGFAVAPAAASPAAISGGFSIGAVTASGDIDSPRTASGGFTLPGVDASVQAQVMVAISGGFSIGAVTVSGELEIPGVGISGGFSVGAVQVTGDVDHEPATVSGGFTLPAVDVSGGASDPANSRIIAGAIDTNPVLAGGSGTIIGGPRIGGPTLTIPEMTFSGQLTVMSTISGGFSVGSVEVSGDIVRPREISGALSFGAATVAGGVVHADVPGSVLIADRAYGSVSIFDERSGSVLITDRLRDA